MDNVHNTAPLHRVHNEIEVVNSHGHNFTDHKYIKKIGSLVETKEFLRVPFITYGYRVNYNFTACTLSLFEFHNETVNIWTHLLGALLWLYLGQHTIATSTNTIFTINLCLFFSGCFFACFFSAIFHWFNCVTLQCHTCLRSFDFSGIGFNVIAVAWPTLYLTFYCNPTIYYIFAGWLAILTTLLLAVPFLKIIYTHDLLRISIYVLSSAVPFFCFIYTVLTEGYSAKIIGFLFVNVFLAYVVFGVGVIIYRSRYPERLYPGQFNYLFASHQIWHCLVVLGQLVLYRGIQAAANRRTATSCNE